MWRLGIELSHLLVERVWMLLNCWEGWCEVHCGLAWWEGLHIFSLHYKALVRWMWAYFPQMLFLLWLLWGLKRWNVVTFDFQNDFVVTCFKILWTNLTFGDPRQKYQTKILKKIQLKYQTKILKKIHLLFNSAKIQNMYSKLSLYIVHQLHSCFLKFQSKHDNEKKVLTPAGYLRWAAILHNNMVNEIKGTTALYFLN